MIYHLDIFHRHKYNFLFISFLKSFNKDISIIIHVIRLFCNNCNLVNRNYKILLLHIIQRCLKNIYNLSIIYFYLLEISCIIFYLKDVS